jgi:SSS family solute:Na+ symporter
MTLTLLDFVVLGAYGVLIVVLSWRMFRRQVTTRDYFIAGGAMPGWAVAMTLMATLIGSGTVVGHPATVYQSGMILLLGNLTLPIVLFIVARYIVPFYRHTVGMSAYEYIGARFGYGGRLYASAGFLADRLFDLGLTMLTTAIAFNVLTGWPLQDVLLWTGIFTVIYTMVGGVEGVVWTSVAQGAIFVTAALVILGMLLFAPSLGSFGAVLRPAWEDGKFNLGQFDLSWASFTDPVVTSQWLFLLAYTANWSRRYIADQHMVQRYLIARSDREASRGALWNGLLCVPIYAVFMFIGACLYGYYKLSGEATPGLADNIVPHYIASHMPSGLVGLFLAAVLAAAMSSIAGDLNSIATVINTDYLEHFRPQTSEKVKLLLGRATVVVAGAIMTVVAILLIPKDGLASLMERGVTIAAILSGGTLGLFSLGFLTRRATRAGCHIGIAVCVLFTGWAVLTQPNARVLDLPINFELNPILIGVLGHAVLFGVGYAASLVFGGYRPSNVDQLTFRRTRTRAETAGC